MAPYTRAALLAASAFTSFAAPLSGQGAGAPTVSREAAVEWGAAALNLTADLLVKTHAAPSGDTPRSDATLLRKLGAELSEEYGENPPKRVAESALVLGADALKLGAEVMAKTAPRAVPDGEQSVPSRAINRRASSPEDRPRAASTRLEAVHATHRKLPQAMPQAFYGSAHGAARAPQSGSGGKGGDSGTRGAAADKKIFDGVASGKFWHEASPNPGPGASPVSLGRLESHAALRSMDDLPMGGGILGAGGVFGVHAGPNPGPGAGPVSLGVSPVSLGRLKSHAKLRSMDDIPMGGGILGGAGGFGGHASPNPAPGAGPVSLGRLKSRAVLRSMDDIPIGGGILGGVFGGHADFRAKSRAAVVKDEDRSGSHRVQRVPEDGGEQPQSLDEVIGRSGLLGRERTPL